MFSGISFGKKPSRQYTDEETRDDDVPVVAEVVKEKAPSVRDEWMTNVSYQDDMAAARREAATQASLARKKRDHGGSGYTERMLASSPMPGGNPSGGLSVPGKNHNSTVDASHSDNNTNINGTVIGDGGASWNQRRTNYAVDSTGVYAGVKKKGDRQGNNSAMNDMKTKVLEEEARAKARYESDKLIEERRRKYGETATQEIRVMNSNLPHTTTTPSHTVDTRLCIPTQSEIDAQLRSMEYMTEETVLKTDLRKLLLVQVYAVKQIFEQKWNIIPMPLDEVQLPGMPTPTLYSSLEENKKEVMFKLAKTIRYLRNNTSVELQNQLKHTAVVRERVNDTPRDLDSMAALQQDAKRNMDREFLKMQGKVKDGEIKDDVTSSTRDMSRATHKDKGGKCRLCDHRCTYKRESAVGLHVRVLVPEKPLSDTHMMLVPKEHFSGQAALDEETRVEFELTKKVVSRSQEKKGQVAVFFEVCVFRNLRTATKHYSGAGFGHCIVHAIGLTPTLCMELGSMIRSEVQLVTESNTALVSLSKRGLRGSQPRDSEISYMAIEFGLDALLGNKCGSKGRYGLLGCNDQPRKVKQITGNSQERETIGVWSEAGYDLAFQDNHDRLVGMAVTAKTVKQTTKPRLEYSMLGEFDVDSETTAVTNDVEEHGRFHPGYLHAIDSTSFPQDLFMTCVASVLHLDVMFLSNREEETDKEALEQQRLHLREVQRPFKELQEEPARQNREQNTRDRTYK